MKTKKENWRITALFAISFAGVVLSISCAYKADRETIHLYIRASEFYTAGNFAETCNVLDGIEKFPPALVLKGKAEYFSGRLDDAEKSFRLAVKKRPSAFEARLYLARVIREKGDLAAAMKITESLLADYPQDIRTLYLAAELADEMGNGAEALLLMDRAAEFSADCAMILLGRARMRWVLGRGADALEDLSRARAMLPWNTPLANSIINLETRIREAL
ncbi:MAG: tetratricopeptide repeat protein [Treponema sp.]|nr:tetratricopeptide repeat protein [Treponema sp.]